MTYGMVDIHCASYPRPAAAVTLDIDDTVDVVHGHQQLSLFNARCDERCFLPIHVYETATARPVAVLRPPGKTPSGDEARRHLRRLVRRIRSHWPATRLTIRGDGHYGRPEVMAWCEANDVDCILGLPGNTVLSRLVETAADDVRVRRAEAEAEVVRRVHHSADPPAQDRWAHHRSRDTAAHRLRRGLPPGRAVPGCRARLPARRAVTPGEIAPELVRSRQLQRRPQTAPGPRCNRRQGCARPRFRPRNRLQCRE
jgi:hypothetical protein